MHQIQRIRRQRLVGVAAAATIAAAMMAGAPAATATGARPATATAAKTAAVVSVNRVIGTRGDTFSPKVLRGVHVGDRITFKGLIEHNATSTTGSVARFASRPGAATFVYSVRKAGRYTYRCTFHRGMTGSFTALR